MEGNSVSGSENTKTDDWEAAGTIACGAGAAVGVNTLGVEFRSKRLNVRKFFCLWSAGYSLGLPVGISLDWDGLTDSDFNKINCDNPFSLNDLNLSTGLLMSATFCPVGFGVSGCLISAGIFPSLFTLCRIYGGVAGFDLGVEAMRGVWLAAKNTNSYDVKRHAVGNAKTGSGNRKSVPPLRPAVHAPPHPRFGSMPRNF